MARATQVLAISALVMGLAPALALACDDDATKADQVTATAKVSTTATATKVICTTTKSTCTVKVKARANGSCKAMVVCKDAEDPVKPANAPGVHQSGWEPGHLIEPDSMKLGPDLNEPDADQYVILSSRAGVVHVHAPWTKKEGKILQQYGPYRVVLLPQLP